MTLRHYNPPMISRIDVKSAAKDPFGESVRHQIAELGHDVGEIRSARIFLIDTDVPADEIRRMSRELLADPIVEEAQIVDRSQSDSPRPDDTRSRIEIHLKPGVMDPVAASTEMAIRDMGIEVKAVRTGRAFVLSRKIEQEKLQQIASRILANG